jgi:hypothetical protein
MKFKIIKKKNIIFIIILYSDIFNNIYIKVKKINFLFQLIIFIFIIFYIF